MGLAVKLGAFTLALAIAGGATAAFVAQSSAHPRVEQSAQAECAGCHMIDYRGAKHHAGERPTTCGVCHTQNEWHEEQKPLQHPFALSGKHLTISCFKCHKGEPAVFHGTPSDCVECHRKEYEGAKDHVEKFPVTCHDCHGFAAWKPILKDAVFPAEKPKPEPTVEPTATTPPTVTPPPTITATVKPHPHPTVKPPPTASTVKTPPTASTVKPPPTASTKPDVVTHPSRHEEE